MAEIFIVLLVLFQFLDYYTTWRCLEGGGRELNPVLLRYRDALLRMGVPGEYTWLWSIKIAVCALLVWLHVDGGFNSVEGQALLVFLVIFYGAVVFNNYRVLRRLV